MFNSHTEAIDWIHSRLTFGIKPGLDRMELLLEELGNPERRIKTVHVAGTNGKGSTVTFLRSILQEAGHQVGTFTSPYIEKFQERISLNGEPISNDDLVQVMNKVKPAVEKVEQTEAGAPTEFEVLTVAAIVYFAEISVPDIAIFEAGLGGRLDSTNVIYPLVSIITSIGHDHMNVLGDTIEEITSEKAGIIKSGVPVITAVSQPEALEVIKEKAVEKNAKYFQYGVDFSTTDYEAKENGEAFTYASPFMTIENLSTQMLGEHQVRNASLALMAVDYLKQFYSLIVDEKDILQGLRKANIMGRFETVKEEPLVILDGAHNPEGVQTLVHTLENRFKDKYIRVLFSAVEDKAIDEMVNEFNQVNFRITFTTFDFPRARTAHELFEVSRFTNKHLRENWKEAIDEEMEAMKEHEVLIVTGSLYFISAVRAYLTN